MTSDADALNVIAQASRWAGDAYETADAILDELDQAGYAVVRKNDVQAIRQQLLVMRDKFYKEEYEDLGESADVWIPWDAHDDAVEAVSMLLGEDQS